MHYAILNQQTSKILHQSEKLWKAAERFNPGTVCGTGETENKALDDARAQIARWNICQREAREARQKGVA